MRKKKPKLGKLAIHSFTTSLDKVRGGTNPKCEEHTFDTCVIEEVGTMNPGICDYPIHPIDPDEPPLA